MRSLVWAGAFLLLVLLGFVVGCAGMVGMPISVEIQVGLYGAGLLLAGFGWLLLATSSSDNSRTTISSAFNH